MGTCLYLLRGRGRIRLIGTVEKLFSQPSVRWTIGISEMGTWIKERLIDWPKGQVQRFRRPAITPDAISDTPWMPEPVAEFLGSAIKDGCVYVEYGCGSSTLFALKKAARVVSVESDLAWLRAVQTRVAMTGASDRFEPIGVNIGLTKELGYPVIGAPSRRRVARWSRYPKAPWTPGRGPVDLVLIEGRFRVACALQSILSTSSETLIVLDDYFLKNQADRG